MMHTFVSMLKNKEIRNKILFTLAMLLIYRIGSAIPVPGVDANALSSQISDNSILSMMNLLGGGCRVPMGAVLESEPDSFCFTAYLADPRDGRFLRRSQRFTALELKSGEKLEKFADEFMGECRRQGILLPLETNGPEAISTFWESER